MLQLLKQVGVNPTIFKGEQNVLLTIITAENVAEACYRLTLFSKYFAEYLPQLAQDPYSPSLRMADLALKKKHRQLFKMLDETCVHEPSTTQAPFSSLHHAVSMCDKEMTLYLLKRYSANSVNHKKLSPLMLAAAKGDKSMMALLLQYGANPDKVDLNGRNALFYALFSKSTEAALFLIPKLKHTNRADREGIRPLAIAATNGQIAVIRLLCETTHCAQDVDHKGRTALHAAAIAGEIEAIRLLVQYGFAVNQVETPQNSPKPDICLKRTPLHLAAMAGHAKAVSVLIELGADPTLTDSQDNTVIECAVISKNIELLHTIQQLPSYHEASHNMKLLHAAAQVNHVDFRSGQFECP